LLSLTASAFSVLGPALAGVIIALSAPGWAIAIDSLTFLISAAFLTRIRLPVAAARVAAGFLTDLRDGWREFRARTWLWVDGLYSALGNALILSPLWALGPVVAEQELGGASSWATIATAFGVGSVVGGVFAIRLRPRWPLRVAVASLLTLALPPALLAIPTGTAAIAVGSFAAGLGLIFFNTIFETAVQQHVPPGSLSRVASIDWVLSVGLQPIGFALAGPAAEAFGLSAALAYAAVWGVVSTLVVLAVPSVRNLPRQEGRHVDPA
jgi:Transmembrane secretion effector